MNRIASGLDDVSSCPTAEACASCGGTDSLRVCTAKTVVGVFCLTLDTQCAEYGTLPPFASVRAAVEAVLAHCVHLGITADEMAALLEVEQVRPIEEGPTI